MVREFDGELVVEGDDAGHDRAAAGLGEVRLASRDEADVGGFEALGEAGAAVAPMLVTMTEPICRVGWAGTLGMMRISWKWSPRSTDSRRRLLIFRARSSGSVSPPTGTAWRWEVTEATITDGETGGVSRARRSTGDMQPRVRGPSPSRRARAAVIRAAATRPCTETPASRAAERSRVVSSAPRTRRRTSMRCSDGSAGRSRGVS